MVLARIPLLLPPLRPPRPPIIHPPHLFTSQPMAFKILAIPETLHPVDNAHTLIEVVQINTSILDHNLILLMTIPMAILHMTTPLIHILYPHHHHHHHHHHQYHHKLHHHQQ
jgi:hypothetical protein